MRPKDTCCSALKLCSEEGGSETGRLFLPGCILIKAAQERGFDDGKGVIHYSDACCCAANLAMGRNPSNSVRVPNVGFSPPGHSAWVAGLLGEVPRTFANRRGAGWCRTSIKDSCPLTLTRAARVANAGPSPAVRCREDARESFRETETPKEQPPPESLRHQGPRAPDSLESVPVFGRGPPKG